MSALQKINDDKTIRARKVLAEARRNLIGHVGREARVAAVLQEARRNINAPSQMSEAIVHKSTANASVAPKVPSAAPRRQTEAQPPSADAIQSLEYRFNILREAVGTAMGEMRADVRNEWRRDNDRLRRELDVIHRELERVPRHRMDK